MRKIIHKFSTLVTFKATNRLGVVELNNPTKRNALSKQMMSDVTLISKASCGM